MKLIINLMTVLIGMTTGVKAQGIQFEKKLNWAQIQARAKAENKYIFMDTYATWCAPCKAMSDETFPDKMVGDFINDKFISVKVQMDQTKNDDESVKSWYPDAKLINQQYKIKAYPTILFFSPDGNLTWRVTGYRNAVELITEARTSIVNSGEFETLYTQYRSGIRDSTLVKRLAVLGRKIGRTAISKEIAQQYIRSLNEQELFKKENLQFVYDFTTSSTDMGFKLFREKGQKVHNVLGKSTVERKLREIIIKEEIAPFVEDKANVPNWGVIERTVKNKYGSLGLEAYYEERLLYLLLSDKKDWSTFGKYYVLYFTTAYNRSRLHINSVSWKIFEHVNDPKILEVAVKTMKYNVDHFDKNKMDSYDTYANLLYKTGKKQEAILWEEKAVKIEEERASKENRKPDPIFAETLEKMKGGTPTWIVEEPKK